MSAQETTPASLPDSLRQALDRFSTQLNSALGEELISVVLYGDPLRTDSPPSSAVNVMIVLRVVTMDALDKAAPAVQQGVRDFGLAVLLLSEDELRRSTDVFPIKFRDMQHRHQLLSGKDVLSELHVATEHLRLRCEQELKNLMLRLQQLYVYRSHLPELLEGTLHRAVGSLLSGLSVLVELKTGDAPGTDSDALEAAEKIGLSTQPVRELLALGRGELEVDAAALKQLYGALLQTVQHAAQLIDAL
jgi:hypothetical protein